MLNEKLPIEKIMLYSGLSQKEVLNIKNSIINERIVTVSDEKENEIFAI